MAGELAAAIRAKFPGAYDNVDDAALEAAIVAKYPQYGAIDKDQGPQEPSTWDRFKEGWAHDPFEKHPIEPEDWFNDTKRSVGRLFSPESAGAHAKVLGQMALGAAIGQGLSKVPMGRIMTASGEGLMAAGGKVPVVGAPARAGIRAFGKSWNETAPKPPAPVEAAPSPAMESAGGTMPNLVKAAKPKLSAAEFTAAMRKEYGSAEAGRRMFGGIQKGAQAGSNVASAAARQAAIKRLAPAESVLPQSAQRAILKELAGSTGQEAFDYAAKAPNAPAQSFIGDQLRAALLERMKSR